MGMEDVRIEDVERIDDERARDPGDVPDGKLRVSVVGPAEAAEVKRERIGEADSQDAEAQHHEHVLGDWPPGHRRGVYSQCNLLY